VRTGKYANVRTKIAYHLSRELGVSRGEITRQTGACISGIAKAIRNLEGAENKCYFSTTSPGRVPAEIGTIVRKHAPVLIFSGLRPLLEPKDIVSRDLHCL
jgi:hypothetical protein